MAKKTRKAKPVVDAPTNRTLAAIAIAFFISRSTDEQIQVLLGKTIRDWVDWTMPRRQSKRSR